MKSQQIQQYVEGVIEGNFQNQSVLDKLSESNQGELLFDGDPVNQGTSNYNSLTNKPSIGGTELSGNKTLAQLGAASQNDLNTIENAVLGLYDATGVNIAKQYLHYPSYANLPTSYSSDDSLPFAEGTYAILDDSKKVYKVYQISEADENTGLGTITWADTGISFDGSGGGTGGTTDYEDLTNKPSINGVGLIGNKTSADLGLVSEPAAGFTPVGTIISVMGNSAPQNYLACNGQTVNVVDYPELSAYFATQFGSNNYFGGDGTTTFGIPDLRGEFLRGTGTNSHENQGDGAAVGVHQDATEIPEFQVRATDNAVYAKVYDDSTTTNQFTNSDKTISAASIKWSKLTGTNAATSGTGVRKSVRPTNTSVLYCIATKNIYIDTETVSGDYELYQYRKLIVKEDPFSRVEYLGRNKNYRPASMDYTADEFNYGDWENAFFIKNLHVCVLNQDGTVNFELDKNDYTKKLDGTASGIASTSLEGNVMVAFPTIYFKRETIGIWEYVSICNKQLDSSFKAYAHTDEFGNIIPYSFEPAFEGYIYNNVMRNISGVVPSNTTTASAEMAAAHANNPAGKNMYEIWTQSSRQMVLDLLTLISCSTDGQTSFGNGHYTGGSSASSLLQTGTLNTKGLFYGTTGNINSKVFGIEAFYGDRWDRVAGLFYDAPNGGVFAKMTYGKQDGSTVEGYNLTHDGYVLIPNSIIENDGGINDTSNKRYYGYIKREYVNEYGHYCKTVTSDGSTSTISTTDSNRNKYECDGIYARYDDIKMAIAGGHCDIGFLVGPAYVNLCAAPSDANWSFGGSLSCKPDKDVQDSDTIVQSWIA